MKRVICILCLLGMLLTASLAEEDNHGLPLPIGDPNPASEYLFTGQSYIYNMVSHDDIWNAENMMNVTFEPCCRTDWHSHAGGQILMPSWAEMCRQREEAAKRLKETTEA